jgi:hypothetical protein
MDLPFLRHFVLAVKNDGIADHQQKLTLYARGNISRKPLIFFREHVESDLDQFVVTNRAIILNSNDIRLASGIRHLFKRTERKAGYPIESYGVDRIRT